MCQIHIGLLFIIKAKTKAIKAFLFLEIVFNEIKGNIYIYFFLFELVTKSAILVIVN